MNGTLSGHLLATVATRPEHLAVADGVRRLSYRQLVAEAGGLASGLRSLGVRRGDRVALVLPNRVETAASVYGVALAGGAVVPIDPSSSEQRLSQILEHCGARFVICDEATAARTRKAAEHCARPPRLVTAGPAIRGEFSYHELAHQDASRVEPLLDVDLATILYPSSLSDLPTGAAFLHRNVDFVSSALLNCVPLHREDRILSVLPLSQSHGLLQLIMSVRIGASLHLGKSGPPYGGLLTLLERESITVLPGNPQLWCNLASLPEFERASQRHLRILTNVGDALAPSLVRHLRQLLPQAKLYLMYGQRECHLISCLAAVEADRRPDSVGFPISGTQLFIRREDGREARVGEVGELWVRGDHVLQGYWGDAKRTSVRLLPGRFGGDRVLRTGDLFRRDASGYLYFVSRREHVITTRGGKVAPAEVERALGAVPGVIEVAVVGVPDRLLGHRLVAHVATLPGATLDVADLRRQCEQRLESFKVPDLVVARTSIPRRSNGAIDRQALLTYLSRTASTKPAAATA